MFTLREDSARREVNDEHLSKRTIYPSTVIYNFAARTTSRTLKVQEPGEADLEKMTLGTSTSAACVLHGAMNQLQGLRQSRISGWTVLEPGIGATTRARDAQA